MAVITVQNETERLILLLVTAASNLPIILTLISLATHQSYFHSFVGWFTMFISICYHCTEALPSQQFILHEGNWHRLDNVGVITSFTLLMVYLMDISNYPTLRAFFELSQFGITILLQERAPWNLTNTLAPILFWSFACLIKHILCYLIYNEKPNYDWSNFKIGGSVLIVAALFFAKGLDDDNDYLRLYHSAWHLLVTIASYWLWQIVDTENPKKKKKMTLIQMQHVVNQKLNTWLLQTKHNNF